MAAAPDGSLFVADTGNHRIQHLSAAGEFLNAWGKEGRHPGEFRELRALAVDSRGHVYAADAHNHRVQKFTAAGEFLAEWGRRGQAAGAFVFPSGLVADDRDRIYVADRSNHRVQVIGPDGAFTDLIEVGYVRPGTRAIIGPLAWAAGTLYAADTFNHVVLRLDLEARANR